MKVVACHQLTHREAYAVMLSVLSYFYNLTRWDVLADVFVGAYVVDEDSPIDPVFWHYWQEAVENVMSKRQVAVDDSKEDWVYDKAGYEAMMILLHTLYESGVTKISEVLKRANFFDNSVDDLSEDGIFIEQSLWDDWQLVLSIPDSHLIVRAMN